MYETMKRMRYCLLLMFLGFTTACQPAAPTCPPGSVTYLAHSNPAQSPADPAAGKPAQQLVEINGKQIQVDQIVQGMLCSGKWSGTVYVPCQIQVYEWEENPDFLKECELDIAPGTVVYVAAHHNEPYYQGCSCHSEELAE